MGKATKQHYAVVKSCTFIPFKIKQVKLHLDVDIEQVVFGISCHFKNYRLAWAINKKLSFHLKRVEDLLFTDHDFEFHFPRYEYIDSVYHIKYTLINNASNENQHYKMKKHLLPEYKQIDYLLLADGYMEENMVKEVLRKLKEIKIVLSAFQINTETVKHKENLMF